MNLSLKAKHGYKIPFRSVYTETIKQWIAEVVFCHFVLRLWPTIRGRS